MIIKNIKKNVLLSKGGKPYAKISIQVDEFRDGKGNMRWIGGFGNKRTWAWKVGDDVTFDLKDDGKYLNFSFDDTDETRLDVYRLPCTVGLALELINGKKQNSIPKAKVEASGSNDEPVVDDDIPF